jgi:hypothetical protein
VVITCTNKVTRANGPFHYTQNQVVTAKPVH